MMGWRSSVTSIFETANFVVTDHLPRVMILLAGEAKPSAARWAEKVVSMAESPGSAMGGHKLRRRHIRVFGLIIAVAAAATVALLSFATLTVLELVLVAVIGLVIALFAGLSCLLLAINDDLPKRFRSYFDDGMKDATLASAVVFLLLVGAGAIALVQASHRSHSTPLSTLGTNTAVELPIRSYVALGDSYSAGEGLAPYLAPTGDTGNRCHRSSRGYPELLSFPSAKPATTVTFVACSGAISAQVFLHPQKAGYPVQGAGTLNGKVGLVTLTMGGNDLHFSDVLKFCLKNPGCMNEVFRPSAIQPGQGQDDTPKAMKLSSWADAMVPIIRARLTAMFTEIHRLAPNARVIAIGYPHLLPPGSGDATELECVPLLNSIRAGTRAAIDKVQDTFNHTIYEAAAASGIEYVDPALLWSGHEACGPAGAWINPGLVRGTSAGPGSFHPTAAGQIAFASILACYLNTYKTRPATTASARHSAVAVATRPASSALPPAVGTKDNPLECTTRS
jgi:hypothetical protein